MDGKELQAIWRSKTASFGAWITLVDAAVTAIICNAGYEWIVIDTEHHPFNPENLRAIIGVARARNVAPIVRVPSNNAATIKQALDFGAEGVIVPLLRSAAEAQEAVAACRYPPHGIRGYNPRDASNFFEQIDDYLKTINERVLVILQVEHIDAVNNLDGILATPGISGILIGPADLSYSMGFPLQIDQPAVQTAIHTTISKCNAVHIPVGIFVDGSPEKLAAWLRAGINFLPLGVDYNWLKRGSKEILTQMQSLTDGR